MLKLIKYEYRKDLVAYLIMFFVMIALEAYVLIATAVHSETNLGISAALFVLGGSAGIFFIMVLGAISYSKEINSKFSYMTFMTPMSSKQILGSKYLSLFFATALLSVLYVAFGYFDVLLILDKFEDVNDIKNLVEMAFSVSGNNLGDAIAGLLGSLFLQWISLFSMVSFAYLAITLSATLLANKKGKGWASFGIFMAIFIVTRVIMVFLPRFDLGDSLLLVLLGSWPVVLFEIITIVGTFFGVAAMLDHKLSL